LLLAPLPPTAAEFRPASLGLVRPALNAPAFLTTGFGGAGFGVAGLVMTFSNQGRKLKGGIAVARRSKPRGFALALFLDHKAAPNGDEHSAPQGADDQSLQAKVGRAAGGG